MFQLLLRVLLIFFLAGYACSEALKAPSSAEIALLLKEAEKGDPVAQNSLGVMYATGRGFPKDEVEAVKWYRTSADQGHALAQVNLGAMYASGRGVPKDEAEAVRWCAASRCFVGSGSN